MMAEHWLSIAAGVFLLGMMLYGHYRGLLRQCVSLGTDIDDHCSENSNALCN